MHKIFLFLFSKCFQYFAQFRGSFRLSLKDSEIATRPKTETKPSLEEALLILKAAETTLILPQF